LPAGLLVAQCCHAVSKFYEEHPDLAKDWYLNSNYIVILASKDKSSLECLQAVLTNNKLKLSSFYEPDIGDELTAIAIEPNEKAKALLSSLPLALRNKETCIL